MSDVAVIAFDQQPPAVLIRFAAAPIKRRIFYRCARAPGKPAEKIG